MSRPKGQFDRNCHSVYNLNYHLVLVIKYREPVINDKICNRLQEIFAYIGKQHGITITEFNHDADHIHVLFKATPVTNIPIFVNAYKSASRRLIKQEFPTIKQKLWHGAFWSKSYCLMTTGGVTIDVIKKYVKKQGKKYIL